MNTPRWDGQRWRIQARHEGRRFSFSSSTPGAKGRRECQKKYDEWYYGEASGEKTVGRVAAEYLEDLKARCGENSPAYEQNECYIRLYIAPKCGHKKICKMTLRDWQNVINEATGQNKPLSEKTLKNLRGIIMGIIKFGYEDYQCEMPRGKLYIPKGHSKKEKEFLDKDDVRRLFEPSTLWYHGAFCLGAITGLRPGEILGLQVGDLQGDRLFVRRSINARGRVTTGKNENARRMIPIGALARGILQSTIQRNEDYNLRTDWIFCSPDGSQGKQNGIRKHWAKLKAERDLPGTCYSLRHTFISMMKMSSIQESVLKDIVGHSTAFDTFGVYGHILDGEEREAAQVIDLTYGAIFGATLSPTDGQNE